MRPTNLFVIFVFCALFCTISTGTFANSVEFLTEKTNVDDFEKTNVILFLAMSDFSAKKNGDGADQNNESGDKYFFDLGFEKRAIVQSCPKKDPFEAFIKKKSTQCNCDDFLSASLMSLINYCRNARGMVTALVSSSIKDYYVGPRFTNGEHKGPPLPELDRDLEYLSKIEDVDEAEDTLPGFPMFYTMPKTSKNRWPKQHAVFLRSIQPEFSIIDTKSAQVINFEEHTKENKPKSLKDNLDLMANLRKTFFDDFFYKEFDPKRLAFDDTNGLSITNFAQPNESSLLNLVKRTLELTQKKSDKGFFVTIMGGHLQECTNPNSDLVRTIKHIEEKTDPKNTLIVVTMRCPNSKKLVPVYAKGPNSVVLSTAKTLPDVPKLIKNTFKKNSIKIEKPQKSDQGEETYGEKLLKEIKDRNFAPTPNQILEDFAKLPRAHPKNYVKRDVTFDLKNNSGRVTILRFLVSVLFVLICAF